MNKFEIYWIYSSCKISSKDIFTMYWWIILGFIFFAVILSYVLLSRDKYIFFEGKIINIDNERQCYKLGDLQSTHILGFDCEWVSKKKLVNGIPKKIAIVQVSDGHTCYLIKLHKFKQIPKELSTILSSNKIYKLGVNIQGDVIRYEKEWDEQINGWVDIRHLSNEIFPNLKKKGLSALSKKYVGYSLNKNIRVICSNWEDDILSYDQEKYASTDAWIAIKIVDAMFRYVESDYKRLTDWFKKYRNMNYGKEYKKKKTKQEKSSNKSSMTPLRRASKRLNDNCEMYHPNGTLLAYVSKGTCLYYINNRLCKTISKDPYKIILNFEPKGRTLANNKKDNVCWNCGENDILRIRKFSIIPQKFRREMKEDIVSHNSYDMAILCFACTEHIHKVCNYRMVQLYYQYKDGSYDEQLERDKEIIKYLVCIKSSFKKFKIPKHIVDEKISKVKSMGIDIDFTNLEVIQNKINKIDTEIYNLKEKIKNDYHKKYVDSFENQEDIIREWRKRFNDSLPLSHKPKWWKVDGPIKPK